MNASLVMVERARRYRLLFPSLFFSLSLTAAPISAIANEDTTSVTIKFKSQVVSYDRPSVGMYQNAHVYSRRARYSVDNAGARRAVLVRSAKPIKLDDEASLYSESLVWPNDLLIAGHPIAYVWVLEPGEHHEFESEYTDERELTTEFSIAEAPSEKEELEWVNLHEQRVSTKTLTWIRANTSQLSVSIPKAVSNKAFASVAIASIEPVKREVRHSTGDIETIGEWRCKFRIRNCREEKIFVIWTEPLNLGSMKHPAFTQSLSWSSGVRLRKLPYLKVRPLEAGKSLEISGRYAAECSFETSIAFAEGTNLDEREVWNSLRRIDTYANRLSWIRSRLFVIRLQVPIHRKAEKAQADEK